jgi:hypothetical protein
MKANEYVLTITQISAPITAYAFGITPMGNFLTLWLCAFGAAEVISKKITGKTLSQHVWTKKDGTNRPMVQRVVLSSIMIAGMLALGYHFCWGDLPN